MTLIQKDKVFKILIKLEQGVIDSIDAITLIERVLKKNVKALYKKRAVKVNKKK